jgi:hypothetical protein
VVAVVPVVVDDAVDDGGDVDELAVDCAAP